MGCTVVLEKHRLHKLRGKKPTPQFRLQSVREIKKFIHKRELPLSWLEPIYNVLIGKYPLDFPLDNSIALRVGSSEITGSTDEIFIIKNKNTGELVGEELSLSIVITSKVKIDQLIRFIKKHKKEIEHWQNIIGLPNYKNRRWIDTNWALEIIRLRDEDRLTFSQIAERMSNKEDLSVKDNNALSSQDNIKMIYKRFKKLFHSREG